MAFFEMHFGLPLAATAAGRKHDTVSKWIKRGELVLTSADREKVGRGGGVNLSARTTLQLPLAVELNKRGLTVPDACEAAINFAHQGDIAGEMGATHNRKAGHLFREGLTLFMINRENPMACQVRHFSGKEPLESIRTSLDAVDLEMLFYPFLSKLGLDALEAMREMKAE
ncbi:hypothetical protein [Heliomarina baculiformis]|uniref:hypothetical protein n=1 Tax=Heliomarina baculiformis TaxID=2872036 RepID=UPI001EE1FB06|nr:hypothetical protein [Heliomarina baculiformis]